MPSRTLPAPAPAPQFLPLTGLYEPSAIQQLADGRFLVVEDEKEHPFKLALLATHPVLAAAARIEDVKSDGGLNIEALEITPDRQRLLVGFRSPLLGGAAIIASITNPSAIFEAGEVPHVSTSLLTLDLGGQGIRGMAWIASLDGYLIISGPASLAEQVFGLWFWNGQPLSPARSVTVPGLQHFERAEGVSAAVMDGVARIVIVSDDGKRAKGRFARFALLEPGQLKISA